MIRSEGKGGTQTQWKGGQEGLNLDPWHKNPIKFCLEFHGNLVMLQNQLFPPFYLTLLFHLLVYHKAISRLKYE